jgi:hypothetical protein
MVLVSGHLLKSVTAQSIVKERLSAVPFFDKNPEENTLKKL